MQNLNFAITQLSPQRLLYIAGGAAPQMVGWAQFVLPVFQPEVDWRRGFSTDHQCVEAGELELGGEESAALRVSDTAGQGRLGCHGQSAQSGQRHTGQSTGCQHQDVARIERVDAGWS